MKKIFQLILTVSIGLTLNSCYYDSIYEPIVNDDNVADLTYTNDIAPIFGFCANCHNGSQAPDLTEANAYNELVPDYVTAFNAEASPLYIKLDTDSHQDLSQSRLNLVKAWINQGALE